MITAKEIFKQMNGAHKQKALDYLRNNLTSKRIFRNDFTKEFWDDLRKRRDGKLAQHVVLNTFGETGSFKSGLNIEIGRFMYPDFGAKDITFTDTEFLSRVKIAGEAEYILRDEITKEYGIGSGRQSAFIVMQTETLRAYRTSMGFISPTEKAIDTAHYVLHAMGHNDFGIDDEGMATEPVYVLAGVMNPMTHNYLGGLIVEIEWMNKVWNDYWKKKVGFLENVRERHFSKSNFFKMADEVMEHPKAQYAKTKYEWILLIQDVFPDLTGEEVKMLYASIKMRKKEGE